MPTTQTRLQLATGSRALADAANDRNVTETLVNQWIDDAVRELWRVKVGVDPDSYAVRATISTTAGTPSYALPADFMQVRRLDRLNGNQTIPINEAPPLLELDFASAGSPGSYDDLAYRVIGGGIAGIAAPFVGANNLWILPDPGTATYYLWYVQSPQGLTGDASLLDCTHGEDIYVMSTVAAKIAERQQKESGMFRSEQERAKQAIIQANARRATGRPKRITDTRSQLGWRKYPRP